MSDSDAAACIPEPFHFFLKKIYRSFSAAALAQQVKRSLITCRSHSADAEHSCRRGRKLAHAPVLRKIVQ